MEKPQKCQLGMSRCVVGSDLVQPERSKVQGVESFPTPIMKKEVWCFPGMNGYYREIIPDYATSDRPHDECCTESGGVNREM